MTIDAYSLCPCSNGQKIKFCCGTSIVGELNQINEQSTSGQVEAAYDRLMLTIDKLGPLDCLNVIRTRMLIGMERFDEAVAVNKELLERSPDNPAGLQQSAMIAFEQGDLEQGIFRLQDAIDLYKGSEIPAELSVVYRIAAVMSFREGNPIASLAHMSFAMALADDESRQALQEDLRSILESTHLLLRQPLVPSEGPEDVPWNKLYVNAQRAVARGQFRRALQFLTKIDQDHPDEAIVLEALAMTKSMLAQEDSADAWQRYADHPDVSRALRIEALCIADLLRGDPMAVEPYQMLTFEISDFAAVSERFISSNWVSNDRSDRIKDNGQVPPRHVFALFSRELRRDETYEVDSELAYHVGAVLLYGKQTDREARLVINVPECEVESVVARIRDIGGDGIAAEPEMESIGEITKEQVMMDVSYEVPPGLDPEVMMELRKREIQSRFVDRWSTLPLSSDDDTTLAEAIQDEAKVDYAFARFVGSAYSGDELLNRDLYAQVCEGLGLPGIGANIDPSHPRSLTSLMLLQLIDEKTLESKKLEKVILYLQSIRATNATRPFLDELLGRDDRRMELETEFRAMRARMADTPEEAMELLEQAINAAEPGSMQEGICRVDRLRAFLVFGEVEKAQAELAAIRPHLNVPYINFLVTTVLTEMGLLRPDLPLEQQIPETASPVSSSDTIIDPSATVGSSSESKLWLPD